MKSVTILILEGWGTPSSMYSYFCPACEKEVDYLGEFCGRCGKKIVWKDEKDCTEEEIRKADEASENARTFKVY